MTLNLAAVDLLLDCRGFNPDTFPNGMTHQDGRPFTEDEIRIVGQATMAELRAVTDYQSLAIEHMREQYDLSVEVATLTAPYFARYGDESTLGDLYPLMTPEDAARLVYIMSRLDPPA